MRTAHSPVGTPFMSAWGPTHIVAATGLPVSFAASKAHSISSMVGKNLNKDKLCNVISYTRLLTEIQKQNTNRIAKNMKER